MSPRPRRASLALLVATLLSMSVAVLAHADGFHGVYSRDGLDGWAVGDAGLAWRTLDGGLTWSSSLIGTGTLRDVAARDLIVLTAGDGGNVWRSANSGGSWSNTVVPGTPNLRAISMPTATDAWIVGDGGTILRTSDAGLTWGSQTSGTTRRLNAVRFLDAMQGWVVGDAGVVLATMDGGASWNPVTLPTSQPLYALDAKGSRVWIGGGGGVAFKSIDGGASFVAVDLGLESGSDVRAAWIALPDSVYLAGGGGFIRLSADGGNSWVYGVHSMHAQISDLWFSRGVGFAASNKFLMPITTVDRGVRWRLPNAATMSRSWTLKQSTFASVRGSTFALNPVDRKTIYCAMGNTLYRSRDEGDTWAAFASIPQCTKVNGFIMSPTDSNVMNAAVSGTIARRLVHSDDHGATWFTTLEREFGEYGIPLEYDHDQPNVMYFGPDGEGLYRSTDYGKNWDPWTNDTVFRSPCDMVVVPGQSNVIVVADGVTSSGRGEYFISTDAGYTFTRRDQRPTGASEIPGLSNSRLRPYTIFGTNWGAGGVQKSRDTGFTWPTIANTGSAWGTDIARDDPNVVIYGVYSGGMSYTSIDSGATFVQTPLSGSNYGFFLRDRGLMLALQSGGIYKMGFTYNYVPQNTQALNLAQPAGGEVWAAGTTHDITWSASNLALARIQYRNDSEAPWQTIAEVPGNAGRYTWTVPNDATTDAAIRVSDAWDSDPEDASAPFTVTGSTVGVGNRATPFALWQNQPNPFTRSTQIHYALPVESDVTLEVFDLQGQRVATLVRGRQSAGEHTVAFGPRTGVAGGDRTGGLAAGVYFYRLQAGTFAGVRKMLILD